MTNERTPSQSSPAATAKAATGGSSTSRQRDPLPMAWIERLFARLSAFYGAKFADLWRGCDLVEVMNTWAEELAGYSGEEIARGLDGCKTGKEWPPTLPEFLRLCRPQLNLQALLLVAAREMAKRDNHEQQAWPSNRLFWAAWRMHYDLTNPELNEKARLTRFELAYAEAAADEHKPIPNVAPASALPAPGKTTISRSEAQQRAKSIGLRIDNNVGSTQWAHDIAADPARYPRASIEAALKALRAIGSGWPQLLVDRARQVGLGNLVDEVAA